MMCFLIISSLALLLPAEKQLSEQLNWPCHTRFAIKTDSKGRPVFLTPEEAARQTTHCEAPIIPPIARSARLEGSVTIEIAVDPSGKVRCVRCVRGHPMLKQSALDAGQKWISRPLVSKQSKTGFLARMVFY